MIIRFQYVFNFMNMLFIKLPFTIRIIQVAQISVIVEQVSLVVPGGAAHGTRDVEVGKAKPVCRESVQIRRQRARVPETSQITVAQIISEYKHEIRRRCTNTRHCYQCQNRYHL